MATRKNLVRKRAFYEQEGWMFKYEGSQVEQTYPISERTPFMIPHPWIKVLLIIIPHFLPLLGFHKEILLPWKTAHSGVSLPYSYSLNISYWVVSFYWWKSLQRFLPRSSRILIMTYWNNKRWIYFLMGCTAHFLVITWILPLVHVYVEHFSNLNLHLLTKGK